MQRNNHLFSSAPDARRDTTGAMQQQRRYALRPSPLAPRIILRLALLLLLPALLWLATPQGAHAQATPLSGTKTVCPAGCDYPALTNADGLFADINTNGLSGDLVAEIRGDLTAETGVTPLNQWTDQGGPWRLTIQPAGGVTRTVEVSSTTDLIKLDGADRVTIDGLNRDVNALVIRKIGSGNAIRLMGGALDNTLRNATVEGYTPILIEAAARTTIANNVIRGASPASSAFRLISSGMYRADNYDNVILDNTLKNFKDAAVYIEDSRDWTISGNTIFNDPSTGRSSAYGIYLKPLDSITNFTITHNTIHNLYAPFGSAGIDAKGQGNLVVTHNRIAFNGPGHKSSSSMWKGIVVGPSRIADVASNLQVTDNQVTLIITNPGTAVLTKPWGINLSVGAAGDTAHVYHNSIYVDGEGAKQAALWLGSNGVATLKNNIVFANRPAARVFTARETFTSDHNLFVGLGASGTTTQFMDWYGTPMDFATWQASSGGDSHSYADLQTNIPVASLFTDVASGDLSIVTGSGFDPAPLPSDRGEGGLGVTTDYSGAPRSLTTPDIGAFEFTVARSGLAGPGEVAGGWGFYDALEVVTGPVTLGAVVNTVEMEVQAAGVVTLTGPITITGSFTNAGELKTEGNGVAFAGGREQNLVLDVFTWFDDLTVYTGTTLIEAVTDDNAYVQGALTNYGVIRKTLPVTAVGNYNNFGLAGEYSYGLEIEVTDRTGDDPLTAIQVDRVDRSQPSGPANSGEPIYWTITGAGSDFVADVTLPHAGIATPFACRYSVGVWTCANTASGADFVTFGGATAFSDWAVYRQETTTTTLASAPNPSSYGQSVTFTATVTAAGGPPTGDVVFEIDDTPVHTGTLTSGVATYVTASLAVGDHPVYAEYVGDANFVASASAVITQTVLKAAAAVTLTDLSQTYDGAPKAATAATAPAGLTVNLTYDGSTTQPIAAGSYTVVGAVDDLNHTGVATDTLVIATAGTTTTLTSAPNPALAGASVTFTASVTLANPLGRKLPPSGPTGNVTFRDGLTDLDTAPLTGGVATFSTSTLAVGSHTITAVYAGDSNHAGNTSALLVQVIDRGVTAVNDAAGALEATPVTIAVLANDHDPAGLGLTVITVTQGVNGAVAIAADGQTVIYTPTAAFTGTDSFTYGVQDGKGATDDALVTVVVAAQAVTDAPVQVAPADPAVSSTVVFSGTTAGVTLTLPAGFYIGTVTEKDVFYLAFTPVVTPTHSGPPSGWQFGGVNFTLEAFVNNASLSPTTFAVPVTITLAYSPGQVAGIKENTLTLQYWNGSAWASDGITCAPPDTVAHTVTCQITHLTDFGLLGESNPTAAALADFGAVTTADAVTVLWTTADESNLAGFHLYRGAAADDPGVRLNEALIGAQGAGGLGGFSYSYVDAVATPPGAAWYYWLETVDFGGGATRHGPILAAALAPRLYLPAVMAGAGGAVLERSPDSAAPLVTPAAPVAAVHAEAPVEVQEQAPAEATLAAPPGVAPDEAAGAAATLHLPLITR